MERKLRREAAEIEAGVDGWDAERSKSEKRKSRKSKEKGTEKETPSPPHFLDVGISELFETHNLANYD